MFEIVRFYTVNFPMSINLKNPTSFRIKLLKIPFAKCNVLIFMKIMIAC